MTETNTSRLTEAITEWFGKRCVDYMEGCPTCDAWAAYDALTARAEKAEAERDTAWNDAIEAAAHECERVAYSGKYPQDDRIELGCLRCRDSIRALAEGDSHE